MAEDGGYIAIRGFAYQFDKALLDMLQHPDRGYQIENFQDHNYEEYAIQVKYYGRVYTAPERKQKIKNIIIKFLKEIEEGSVIKYCIYSYFNGVEERSTSLDIDQLNDYLGNKKDEFDGDHKFQLIKGFKLIYAPDFKAQFRILIRKISKEYSCDESEACCYHAMMVSHLERLVLRYKIDQAERRACSKEDLDRLIHDTKDVIFRTAYLEFLGREKFQHHIHKLHFNRRQFEGKERIFIIEPPSGWGLYDLRQVLYDIARKWGKNGERLPNAERCSPYFHLRIEAEELVDLKQIIVSEGKFFKDGYYFKGASFAPDILMAPQTKHNKFDMLFINEADEIAPSIEAALRPKEIFQFYYTTPLEIDADVNHVKIQIVDLDDILRII